MSHVALRPTSSYRRVPSRLRRSRLPSWTSPGQLGPNSYRALWLAQIGMALISFALLLESLPRLAALRGPAMTWSSATLSIQLAMTVVLLFLGVRRQASPWPATVQALTVLGSLLVMPLFFQHSMLGLPPWITSFVVLAAGALAYSWGLGTAVGYAVVAFVAFQLMLLTVPGAENSQLGAFYVGSRLIFAIALSVLAWLHLRAAGEADRVYNEALAQATALKRSRSQSEDQERLDRLIHDNVMAALLDASRNPGPVLRQTRELAQRALAVLEFEERRASGTATTMIHVMMDDLLEALAPWRSRVRVNFLATTIRPDGHPRAFLPADIAQALVQAATEAVSNSARHSGAEVTYVTMDGGACAPTRINPLGFFLTLEVMDRGKGFQMRSMDSRRLGVRVSIMGNVRNVGGDVDIISLPHRGTKVRITWPRDVDPLTKR